MTIINASPGRTIQIGYEGEDRVTVLRFRYSADWLENGEGIFHIRVRRHGEHTAYNAALVADDAENNCLLMTVTNVELSVKGSGEMQVVYSGADFVKKSPIYSYNVSRAVDEAVDPPAQDVYTQIIESLSDLQMDVQGKADVQTVSALADEITDLNSDVQGLQTIVQGKADTQTVTALSGTVTDLQANKADKTYVDTELAGKASTQTVSDLVDDVYDIYPTDTASGVIANFPDGANSVPVKSLTVAIEPVQDLHGYSNPWPGGATKNKMPNAIPKTETINGVTFTLDQFGVFTANGTATSEAMCRFPIGYSFTILDGDPRPKLALNNTQATSALFQFFNGNVQVDSWGINPVNRVQEYSSMCRKTCNEYIIRVPKDATVNFTMSPMIVENSESDYSYIPYSNICPITGWDSVKVTVSPTIDEADGQTYDITIPSSAGTVYGGTLDVTNGVLTVDRANVDLGTLFWYKTGTTGSHWRFWTYLNDMAYGGEMLSSQYKHITATQSYLGEIGIASQVSGSNYLAMVTDERFSDAATFKTAMCGVQLVYELATPITYQLTPQEVSTLLGQNNIWADAGDTTVEYRANTSAYIAKKIAEAISALS